MLRSASTLAAQILPACLLIALGWGFHDLPHLFSDPARIGLAVTVVGGTIAAVLLQLDFNPLRKGAVPLAKQSFELTVLLLLSLVMLWFLPFADRRKILTLRHEFWRYLGLLFCFAGIALRVAALHRLGPNFSAYVTLQPQHRLVKDGIYAVIRHPLYLSLLLAPAGIALVFASWLSLPIAALAGVFVLDRMRTEERLLATHFASEFEGYRRRTWQLLPLLF